MDALSVIPTGAEGSRAVCGAQARMLRIAGSVRLELLRTRHRSEDAPADGVRSLDFPLGLRSGLRLTGVTEPDTARCYSYFMD